MKVRVYPSDKTGSGAYRINLPAQAAQAAGVEVEWGSTGEPGEGMPIERTTDAQGRKLVRPKPIPDDVDVLVLQRAVDETLVAMIPQIQKAGFAVVVDVDDDLSRVPPTHPAARVLNPTSSPTMNFLWLRRACQMADLVTVSTPMLAARYGAHGRVRVLENRVPEHVLDIPHAGDGQTVGWSGGTVVHPGDLEATRGGVADALRRSAGRFLQVGPPLGVRQQLGLDEEPDSTGGLPDIEDYYRALARLDVGIAPLHDSAFNSSKSWLKPLEMNSVGAVPVMSPRAEYLRIHELGVGVLAEKPREWRRQVVRLLADEDTRINLMRQGQEAIREHLLIERSGHLWAEAWEDAVQYHRERHRERVAA